MFCCAFQAPKVGAGSEDAGSKGKGVEQDHSEHSWVWFCSQRRDVDEPCRAFPNVFLSSHPLSSVSSLGLLFSDVSLTQDVCQAVMEGTAAQAEHPCAGTRPAATRCVGASGVGPSGPASSQLSPTMQGGLLCCPGYISAPWEV